jgi:hypothetical protein
VARRAANPRLASRRSRQPDLYTEELVERICRKVATLGVSAHVAAASEGVTSTSTVSTWVAKSEAGDPRYAGFSEKLTRARGGRVFARCASAHGREGLGASSLASGAQVPPRLRPA